MDAGVHLHHPAQAISMQTDVRGELASVRIADTQSSTETDVPCTHVVIAAGAWSPAAFRALFPRSSYVPPVSSLAGHSLVVRTPRWDPSREQQQGAAVAGGCHAVFLAEQPGYSPEIFSRTSGNIYLGGLNSATEPLPPLPTDTRAMIRTDAIRRLRETARELMVERRGEAEDDDDLEIVREGLCFRPVTESGLPIVGRVPDELLGVAISTRAGPEGGVYMAAGHGPWGISLSLGTGKVLAEMVQGREPSADVSALGVRV